MMRGTLAIVGLGLTLLTSCDRQPAQDYAVNGRLRFASRGVNLDAYSRQGYTNELHMTIRTSPDVGDVIVQRRWINITTPHTYGLGMNRGAEIRAMAKGKKVWVTALLTLTHPSSKEQYKWGGWTAEPVAVGSEFVDVFLEHRLEKIDPKIPGFPTGGWYSPSCAEEAVPPGLEPQTSGKEIWAGTIDVPEDKRDKFRGWTAFLVARFYPERGQPELVARYDSPVFPFSFSLHEGQLMNPDMAGDFDDPMHVVLVIDRDGSIATPGDSIRVVTPERVAPGTDDIEFKVTEEDIGDLLTATPGGNPGGHASGGARNASAESTELIVSGRIEVAPDVAMPVGAKVYVWTKGANGLVHFRQLPADLIPGPFELRAGDTMNRQIVGRTDAPLKVKAVASVKDVMGTGPDDLVIEVADVVQGTSDLVLVLALKK